MSQKPNRRASVQLNEPATRRNGDNLNVGKAQSHKASDQVTT